MPWGAARATASAVRRRGARALAIVVLACAAASGCRTLRPLPDAAALGSGIGLDASRQATSVDATTIERKLLFGYQGWFGCPGDGSPLDAWEHWFERGAPASAETLNVDMWPDVAELGADERCETPFRLPGGGPAHLYSAYNAKTVERHFRWMRDYDLSGAFLQRFTVHLDTPAVIGFRDAVARNVRAAAEANGRVFAVMYDISGHPGDTVVDAVKRDWVHLVDTLRLTESPRYLHHGGRPLLAIWGFGFRDRSPTPEQAAELIAFFRRHPDPRYRVTLLGGVPAGWRTLTRDSRTDPKWARVYRSFDVISPWTVGRFRNEPEVDRFYAEETTADLVETRRLGIGYMPVVFPGFSWRNLNGRAPLNAIPRRGGRFYWRQVERALRSGNTMLYGAMFDEVDEGTAMFKVAASARDAPAEAPMVTLDLDGEALPSDWYLRLARETQKRLTRVRSGARRDARQAATSGSTRHVSEPMRGLRNPAVVRRRPRTRARGRARRAPPCLRRTSARAASPRGARGAAARTSAAGCSDRGPSRSAPRRPRRSRRAA
jgi:hypothetical protein